MFKKIFLLVTVTAMLLPLMVNAETAPAQPSEKISRLLSDLGIQELGVRREAPPFTLSNLEGKEVSLKDYRGKIVFLNFWTTWCPACREEMPSMEKLHQKFKGEDFIILAVDLRERLKTVKSFMQKNKLTFSVLMDSTGKTGDIYKVRGIPTTYLIDRQGRIVGKAVGSRDWAGKKAFALIEALLAE